MFAEWLREATTPLLIATGTLLAMISLRNSDIATRARNNVDEALYKVCKLDEGKKRDNRLQNIRAQNQSFLRRYRMMSWAFSCLAVSICLFAVANVLLKKEGAAWLSGIVGLAACALLGIGLCMTVVEFIWGPGTLKRNGKSLDESI